VRKTRAKVFLRKLGREPLSYDYQHLMATTLFQKQRAGDLEFSTRAYAGGVFTYYTFSYIRYDPPPVEMRRADDKTGLLFEQGHFILSSPDERFIRTLGEGLLAQPLFALGGVRMKVEQVRFLPEPRFTGRNATFKMISPLHVKTLREVGGRLLQWDLYPSDEKFYEHLRGNLMERYLAFYGKEPHDDRFHVEIFGNIKAKRHTIQNLKRRASLLSFNLEAAPELVRFGYETGFGEKTADGFGCVELLDRRHQRRSAGKQRMPEQETPGPARSRGPATHSTTRTSR